MENTNQFSLMNFSERVQDEDLSIKFYFITNDDGELSNEMQIAHEVNFQKIQLDKNFNFSVFSGTAE
jgi:hypothetical protein